MDSSDSSGDNGDTNNITNILCGVPMLAIRHRYAFLRLKRDLN